MSGGLWWIEPLPESVTARGIEVPLCTDFRRWILLLGLMEDDSVDALGKVSIALGLVCRQIPENRDPEFRLALLSEIVRFAALGKTDGGDVHESGGERLLDFREDGERIVGSFWQTYGVDLTSVRMHWWVFAACLHALPPDCALGRAVRLRMTDPSEIGDDVLRRKVRRARRAVRLGHRGMGQPIR